VKQRSALVESALALSNSRSLGYVNGREKILAREIGTVRIFMDESRRGREDELDGRAELHGAK
jgi:hypothetical protein